MENEFPFIKINKVSMRNILGVFILSVLSGCDVPGVLKINNKTYSDINIRVCLEKEDERDCRSKNLTVKSGEFGYISFGFGTRWTEPFITKYAEEAVDTIHLQVGLKAYYCSSQACKMEIFNLFNRRTNRKLEISIDSTFIQNSLTAK